MANNDLIKSIVDIAGIAKIQERVKKIHLLPNIITKDPLTGARGVGYGVIEPACHLFTTNTSQYDMTQIIDGVKEPKVTEDAKNNCDTLDTIIGLKDNTTPYHNLRLNPDGIVRDISASAPTTYWVGYDLLYLWHLYYITSDADNGGAGYTAMAVDLVNTFTTASPDAYITEINRLSRDAVFNTFTTSTRDIYYATYSEPVLVTGVLSQSIMNAMNNSSIYFIDASWPMYTIKKVISGSGINPGTTYKVIVGVPCTWDPTNPQGYTGDEGIGYAFPLTASSQSVRDLETDYAHNSDPDRETFATNLPTVAKCSGGGFQLSLSKVSGKWEHHVGEDYPVKYTAPVSTVKFRFGTRYGIIQPAKEGGFMLYEATLESNDPIGTVRVYRSNRTLLIKVPAASMVYYLP